MYQKLYHNIFTCLTVDFEITVCDTCVYAEIATQRSQGKCFIWLVSASEDKSEPICTTWMIKQALACFKPSLCVIDLISGNKLI